MISFLNPILENEWSLSEFQQTLLGSLVFVGVFIGCILSGQLGDRFGRRKPLLGALLFNFLFGFASSFSPNYASLVVLRFFFGINMGLISNLSAVYLSEITPKDIRGRVLVFFQLFYTFGELLTILFAYIFLNNFNSGNWRAMAAWSSIPSIITFLFCFIFMSESPRYLLVKKQYDDFFILVKKIIKINHKKELFFQITDEEILGITNWAEQEYNLHTKGHNISPKELFLEHRKYITLRIWIIWFGCSCVYSGIIFVLPGILKKINHNVSEDDKNDLFKICVSVISELPASLVALYLVENKKFGRKNSIIITFFLVAIFNFLAFYGSKNENFFIIITSGARFFLSMTFSIIYPFTTEIYPTQIRVTGLGFASAFSRIGSISMPWIAMLFYEVGDRGPFLAFGIVSVIAFLAAIRLPFDTTGIELDKYCEENEEENNNEKNNIECA